MSTVLQTERLTLRPPVKADAPAVARYLNNFAVAGNLARVPYPYALSDAERWLFGLKPEPAPEETGFAIDLPGADIAGTVGLHLTDGEVELGYWIAEPFWHRGLMTEATRAVVGWFFRATDEPHLRCGAFHFNKASLAIQKKLGFLETGISSRRCLARDEDVRHIDTQLTRARWKDLNP